MILDGLVADAQFPGDFLVAQSVRDVLQDFHFAWRKGIERLLAKDPTINENRQKHVEELKSMAKEIDDDYLSDP